MDRPSITRKIIDDYTVDKEKAKELVTRMEEIGKEYGIRGIPLKLTAVLLASYRKGKLDMIIEALKETNFNFEDFMLDLINKMPVNRIYPIILSRLLEEVPDINKIIKYYNNKNFDNESDTVLIREWLNSVILNQI